MEELKQTPQGAKDLENNNITYEHLCGEGEWDKPEDQARVLSKFILDKVSKAAYKAFNHLPTVEPTGSFLDVKQSPSESFLQFVDQLRAQVERQVRDPKTQMEIVKEMAQRNANEVCTLVLLGLPLNPPPTLAEMIEACARKAELFAAREAWSRPTNPETVAAVSPGVRRRQMSPEQLTHVICFICKKPGHFAQDCPQNQQQKTPFTPKNSDVSANPPGATT